MAFIDLSDTVRVTSYTGVERVAQIYSIHGKTRGLPPLEKLRYEATLKFFKHDFLFNF